MKPAQENRSLHFESLLADAARARSDNGHRWLDAQRADAARQFLHSGLPSRADEAWRYTPLDPLLDTPWSQPGGGVADVELERRTLTAEPAARLVFIDGRWSPTLSEQRTAHPHIRIGGLHNALDEQADDIARWLGGAIPAPNTSAPALSSFAALNTALLQDGAWIHIGAGIRPDGPIELLYLCTAHAAGAAAPAIAPRNLIVLEAGATATVVEHYAGIGDGAYFTNALTEIQLGEGAELEHARLQDEPAAARHFSNVYLRQARASRYRGFNLSLGALWSRTEFHNSMQAEQAQFSLDGLYVAGDGQLTDMHLDVDHAVPDCASRERFKGILLGRGRAVFDGRILVRVDAQKTDAHLSNDNLLLSRDAEIDTKPQLEIYADDVKCSHGTTVGQLEPSQLFYLRARGIDAATARRMLCLGFAMELLESCPIEGLRTRVERRLTERLAVADTTTESTER